MKLIEKYVNNINLDGLDGPYYGSFIWIDELNKGMIHKNIKCIEFESLYQNLLIYFHDSGLLKSYNINIDIEIINKIRYFIDNKKTLPDSYRIESNELFSNLLFDRNSRKIIGIFTKYMKQYYKEIIEYNRDNILYIDTDQVFYINDINMIDINLPYNNLNIDLFIYDRIKKYCIIKDGIFKMKGIREKDKYKSKIVLSVKKSEKIKNYKLNTLLNE